MAAVISKEMTFDAAHFLPKHEGKCHNLHGHTYKIECAVHGEVDPETGMLLDYAHLKEAMKSVVDLWDHAFLSHNKPGYIQNLFGIHVDLDFLMEQLVGFNLSKTVSLGKYTTAENLSLIAAEQIGEYLVKHFSHVRWSHLTVTLWETPTSSAVAQVVRTQFAKSKGYYCECYQQETSPTTCT